MTAPVPVKDFYLIQSNERDADKLKYVLGNLEYTGIPAILTHSPSHSDLFRGRPYKIFYVVVDNDLFIHYARLAEFGRTFKGDRTGFFNSLPDVVKYQVDFTMDYCLAAENAALANRTVHFVASAETHAANRANQLVAIGMLDGNDTKQCEESKTFDFLRTAREDLEATLRAYIQANDQRPQIVGLLARGFPDNPEVWCRAESFPNTKAVVEHWRTALLRIPSYVAEQIDKQLREHAAPFMTRCADPYGNHVAHMFSNSVFFWEELKYARDVLKVQPAIIEEALERGLICHSDRYDGNDNTRLLLISFEPNKYDYLLFDANLKDVEGMLIPDAVRKARARAASDPRVIESKDRANERMLMSGMRSVALE